MLTEKDERVRYLVCGHKAGKLTDAEEDELAKISNDHPEVAALVARLDNTEQFISDLLQFGKKLQQQLPNPRVTALRRFWLALSAWLRSLPYRR